MSQKPAMSEAKRSENDELAQQYRAIGPAALVAALLCAAKKDKPAEGAKKAA